MRLRKVIVVQKPDRVLNAGLKYKYSVLLKSSLWLGQFFAIFHILSLDGRRYI